ncbi:MAG: helix-turn-helix domain-containing protein [Desulfocucumaceae bacterium]
MKAGIKTIMGDGHYPFGPEHIQELFEEYSSDQLFILIPKAPISLPQGTHSHECYEFFMPLSGAMPSRIGKESLTIEKNRLLSINSGQEHGLRSPVENTFCIGMHVQKDFLQEVSRQVYGKGDVCFKPREYVVDTNLLNLTRLFMEEARYRQSGYRFILEGLDTQISVSLLRMAKNDPPPRYFSRDYRGKNNIRRAVEFLWDNYNGNYSLKEVSRVANLSPYHFIRVFRAETGKTPYDFLLDVKIERAREMLKTGRQSVSEVCFACGFNNISHFTAAFKKRVGITPSEYRKTLVLCK